MAVQTFTITQQAGTDQFCSIAYALPADGKLSSRTTKMFTRFILPSSLNGIIPTAAVLKRYFNANLINPTYPGTITFTTKSTIGTWSGLSTAANLDALTLSSALATTTNFDPYTNINTWLTFDVLGTSTEGIRYACENSLGSITLVQHYASGACDLRTEAQCIGDVTITNAYTANYLAFDYPGNSSDGTHPAYLEITADITVAPPSTYVPKSGISVCGLMY